MRIRARARDWSFVFPVLVLLSLLPVSAVLSTFSPNGVFASGRPFAEVWTDRGEGGIYEGGEALTIYFRASEDGYVTIFNINPAGRVQRVFPNRWESDNMVRRGHLYAIPAAGSYRFVTGAPFGTETVFALVTLAPPGDRIAGDAWLGRSPVIEAKDFATLLRNELADVPETEWGLASTFFRVRPRGEGSV